MRFAWALALLVACGPKITNEHRSAEAGKHLPATLEAERPREGDPRSVLVRVYADAGIRALPKWREEIGDQIDYASQLLTPLIGARITVESIKDWDRKSDPSAALTALAELDKGDNVTWVIGYVTPGDVASKAMTELGRAEPLGRHVVVRGWAEKPETEVLSALLPDLKETERTEVMGAHRRHKQTVVLVHMLAITLGTVAETDPSWIRNLTYSPKQVGFSDRNRELLQLGLDARLAEESTQVMAKKLLEAIEKNPWGGWVASDQEQVSARLRNTIDASKAGRTAAQVPPEAYDQYNRIRELAKRGNQKDALIELENLLVGYPGNAAMHQLKCEIMLGAPGVADPTTRAACKRASDYAPGDPAPHIAVGEALLKGGDTKGARGEFVIAEGKIKNLGVGVQDAWRKLVAIYHAMGALTWTEEAIAKGKLENDPIATQVAQTRARYGVARGSTVVSPEQEAVLVAAVRKALDLVYASKFADAERTISAAEKKWPGAAGLAGARCDLAYRTGAIAAARAACNRALATDPHASWALYLSGTLLLRDAGSTPAGIEKLKLAIKVDPELGQAWRTLAKAYARAKDRKALDQLGKDYEAKFGQPLPR
jgi:predicted Zn-dependent protease